MTDWAQYRSLFPHVSNRIYLNHAGIAPFNLRGKAALLDFVEKRLDKDIEFWPAALERKAYFLELIARFIHAPKENISLVTNTSAGLNILTLGLSWKAGDRILLNDFEFPSNVIPFTNLKRLGVEIDWVHHHDGILEIDDIRKKITPRTRLLSISLVEFVNGFRNNVKALGEICREHGIIFSVDAIQALGALKVDVEEMGIVGPGGMITRDRVAANRRPGEPDQEVQVFEVANGGEAVTERKRRIGGHSPVSRAALRKRQPECRPADRIDACYGVRIWRMNASRAASSTGLE